MQRFQISKTFKANKPRRVNDIVLLIKFYSLSIVVEKGMVDLESKFLEGTLQGSYSIHSHLAHYRSNCLCQPWHYMDVIMPIEMTWPAIK